MRLFTFKLKDTRLQIEMVKKGHYRWVLSGQEYIAIGTRGSWELTGAPDPIKATSLEECIARSAGLSRSDVTSTIV